jgi:hypothetical protein
MTGWGERVPGNNYLFQPERYQKARVFSVSLSGVEGDGEIGLTLFLSAGLACHKLSEGDGRWATRSRGGQGASTPLSMTRDDERAYGTNLLCHHELPAMSHTKRPQMALFIIHFSLFTFLFPLNIIFLLPTPYSGISPYLRNLKCL